MCTAISYKNGNHYFGRNLDYEHGFGEKILITPRNYPIKLNALDTLNTHYAMIGMGICIDNYPLYFDGTNEYGLSIAGLNFPGNAHYFEYDNEHICITPFELPLWLLARYKTIKDCLETLTKIQLTNIPFSNDLSLTDLHWLISDSNTSIVLESTKAGLKIYDNPYGVLTNNPPFDYHIYNLSNYMNITALEPQNRFCCNLPLKPFSRGMGGIGLPGDSSSQSRFVRAVFNKSNSVADLSEDASVSQFFHILNSVYQVNGSVVVGDRFEKTIYSSCCNTDKGMYYYTTYENSRITCINMHNYNLDAKNIISIPLSRNSAIKNAL